MTGRPRPTYGASANVALAFSLTFSLIVPLFFGATAHATLFPPWTTQDLAERADLVAVVTITRVDARWLQSGRRIATFYDANVVSIEKEPRTDASKVDVTAPLSFALPGGEVGEWGQHVPGTPRLHVGDRAVVFLSAPVGPNGERRVVGLGLGVLRLVDGDGRPNPRLSSVAMPGGDAPAPPATLFDLRRALRGGAR